MDFIDKELLKFIENLYKHFDFEDIFYNENNSDENNSGENNSDENNSDENNSGENNSDENNSDDNNSDENNSDDNSFQDNDENNTGSDFSSYNTSNSSFVSHHEEYEKKYDKFHLKRIFDDIDSYFDEDDENDGENDDEDNLKKNNEKNIKKKYLLKYIKDPILKLTDFGLMKKNDVNETTNARNYRCPEIILGYKCSKEVDYWSLEMTIYELKNGKMLYNYHKTEEHGFYDNDLISMKLILENANKEKYNEYIDLIKKSNRRNYILTKQKTLLFYKKI
jgi:hypothetical protein